MAKRRIYWPHGNPRFDAWSVDSKAGNLIVRRNHDLNTKVGSFCQGYDIWLDQEYLGAIGSRSIIELETLTLRQLRSAAKQSCCGLHEEEFIRTTKPRKNLGGARLNAGRKCKGEDRRVILNTTVDPTTLELLDNNKGNLSRGEFIDEVFKRYVKTT